MGKFLKFYTDDRGVLHNEEVKYNGKKIPYEVLRRNIGNIIQYIYHVDLGKESLALVVDDEGLYRNLRPTFWLYYPSSMKVERNPLVGNVLVVGLGKEEAIGLTDKDIELVMSKIMVNKVGMHFLPMNEEYIKSSNDFLNSLFGDLS